MKKSCLLSHAYKTVGWVMLIPAIIMGIILIASNFNLHFDPQIKVFGYFDSGFPGNTEKSTFRWGNVSLLSNLICILILVGGMFVMFSKEKKEDEFINQMRLKALQISVGINYVLLFVCVIFIYGLNFLSVMVYNMFTIIIIYILVFHYLIIKSRVVRDEQ